jgi:hypothetical protein
VPPPPCVHLCSTCFKKKNHTYDAITTDCASMCLRQMAIKSFKDKRTKLIKYVIFNINFGVTINKVRQTFFVNFALSPLPRLHFSNVRINCAKGCLICTRTYWIRSTVRNYLPYDRIRHFSHPTSYPPRIGLLQAT